MMDLLSNTSKRFPHERFFQAASAVSSFRHEWSLTSYIRNSHNNVYSTGHYYNRRVDWNTKLKGCVARMASLEPAYRFQFVAEEESPE